MSVYNEKKPKVIQLKYMKLHWSEISVNEVRKKVLNIFSGSTVLINKVEFFI